MKRFAFTLQAVEDIALAVEKQLKLEMQKIEERLRQTVRQITDTEAERAQNASRCMQKMRSSGMDAELLVHYQHYQEKLDALLEVLRADKAKIEQEKEACLHKQIENRKELKTLEKLREKQLSDYQAELRLEEEKEIGDLVSYRTTLQ